MVDIKAITEEYLGSLNYVKEIKRSIEITPSPDIVVVVGPRHAGKTFLMLKKVRELLDSGEQAAYVPFDDPELHGLGPRDFAEAVRKSYPEGRVHIFLDEVQEWKGWDFNLRWLHDVKDFNIYASGSSSKLQSSEIPSKLRGRYISRVVLPLSFREIAGETEGTTFRERGAIGKLLDEYIRWGGFPEVWAYRSREKVISLVETMFYRDIVERHRVRDIEIFRNFMYFMLSNYSNNFTWHSLRRAVEFKGLKLDTKSIIKYASYMQDAFMMFTIKRFSYSERERMNSPKKAYLVDTSISSMFESGSDLGRKIENVVFVELMRRFPLNDIYYYVNSEGEEIDFLVRGSSTKLIEVTVDVDENHLRKVALAASELGVKDAQIISYNNANGEDRATPLWKWLLGPIKPQ